MAHFCPTLPRHLAIKAGEYAELELLQIDWPMPVRANGGIA